MNKLRRNRDIRQLAEDYGYFSRYRHVTLTEFKYTRTSAVEREILDMEEFLERVALEQGRVSWQQKNETY